MKKIKYLIVTFLAMIMFVPNVYAASASLSVSKSSIENGSKVTATVYISNAAAWNIKITSSGSTSGCTEKFVGDSGTGNNTSKSFSVTCKSTAVGIINFVMSGDITSSDGTNTKISGSKGVNVTTPRAKSTNNKLKSLSVTGFNISPDFKSDVNEYTLTVPSTTDKITINAENADGYASLSGTGEVVVNAGTNTFEIVSTSETGVSNTYKLTVNVEDLNPIKVVVDKVNYTVVKEAKNLTKPELFDETTVKIGDFDIPAFTNKVCNYTLVGLKDEKGNISLYIYTDGLYTKYNEFTSNKISVVFLKFPKVLKGYTKSEMTINEQKMTVLKHDDSILLYGMNLETGKKNYYSYDKNEKTIQIFNLTTFNKNNNDIKTYKLIILISWIVLLILIIITILMSVNNHKFKKIIKPTKKTKEEVE